MENDYRLPTLERFINNVLNPVSNKDKDLMDRYQRFHAVVYYFEYATGMVRAQEYTLRAKEADAMTCGSAIAAYVYMHDCFTLIEEAIKANLNREIKQLKRVFKPLAERIERIRHELGSHPEATRPNRKIARKRSGIVSDGRLFISGLNLHPRRDLEELRNYLERIGVLLEEQYRRNT